MQIRWKIRSTFLNVTKLLWCLANIINVSGDKTTCRSSIETGNGLHFICFCDVQDLSDSIDINKDHLAIDLKPDSDGKNDFSLAKFAYNLSGAYFRKKIHITFQYCRHLTILLDQNELNRIGSEFFRPDIQVSSCFIEHVYHLDILRSPNALSEENKQEEQIGSKSNMIKEYAATLDDKTLDLTVYAVALVKVHSGANFTSLVTSTRETNLYIDITDGVENNGPHLDTKGFLKENVYFITRKEQKIRLKENEDINIKMKELVSSAQLQKVVEAYPLELSLALVVFAIVILIGIVGLGIVVCHRQKRKRQLKALLRSKNLGPLLSSREIAKGISSKYLSPKYTHMKNTVSTPPSPGISSKPSSSKNVPPLPLSRPITPAAIPDINEIKSQNKAKHGNIKADINELWSSILYRVRKSEYNNRDTKKNQIKKIKSSNSFHSSSTFNDDRSSSAQTSFFYREDSMKVKNGNTDGKNLSRKSSVGQDAAKKTRSRSHSRSRSRSRSRCKSRSGNKTPPTDEVMTSLSEQDDKRSYISRISQQVYLSEASKDLNSGSFINPPLPIKVKIGNPDKNEKEFEDNSLKTKQMTFFSSVSRTVPELHCGNLSSDNGYSGSCGDNDIAKDTRL